MNFDRGHYTPSAHFSVYSFAIIAIYLRRLTGSGQQYKSHKYKYTNINKIKCAKFRHIYASFF